MPSQVITVQYVNNPQEGRKEGSIKDSEGVYWGVPPSMLGLFATKGTYEVQYEDSHHKGKTYHHIKSVKNTIAATNGATAAAGPSSGRHPARNDDLTAERIFVCGVINSAIKSGRLAIQTDALVVAVGAARDAWKATFGTGTKKAQAYTPGSEAQPGDDMNDEIPF